MRRSAVLVMITLTTACSARPAPAPLFESRVAFAPLAEKLRASAGDPGKVLRPRRAADVAVLEAGKRYKFVVLSDGSLAIAPLPADTPANEYVHPILADGRPVLTAGNIRLERQGTTVLRVTLDQDSKAYCPTGDSLVAGLRALVHLGVAADVLRVENRPATCVDAQAATGPRYGALMAEVGSRFERLGRAANAGRYELAEFERGEIEEIFEEDLPKAELPRESAGVNLAGAAQAFRETNLPDLEKALGSKNPVAVKRAYALAAETCNGCHRASGHRFIEISEQPGQGVPRLDPVR